jgi:glycosyltransferase involved in cell wall biosynthesis
MNGENISVIIPTLNSARFVGEAIQSVLKQSVAVREILVVDGGSTDGTQKLVSQISPLVRILSQEGRGRAGARNTGMRQAVGDFIALLDSDDLWVVDKLEVQFKFFREHPDVEFIFGDMSNFIHGRDGDVLEILDGEAHDYLRDNPADPKRLLEFLFRVNFVPTSSVLFKKSCLRDIGFMNELFAHSEDYEYWLRFAAGTRVGFVDQVLVRRRLHDSNAMKNAYVAISEATLELLNQWRKKSDLQPETSKALLCRIASLQYNLSSRLIKSGRFKDAYSYLRQIQSEDFKTEPLMKLKICVKTLVAKSLRHFNQIEINRAI